MAVEHISNCPDIGKIKNESKNISIYRHNWTFKLHRKKTDLTCERIDYLIDVKTDVAKK